MKERIQGGQPRAGPGLLVFRCRCGKTFGDSRSLSEHRRFCPAVEELRQKRQQLQEREWWSE